MALHPDLLKRAPATIMCTSDMHTSIRIDISIPPSSMTGEAYQHLYGKIVRLTSASSCERQAIRSVDLITGLPVGNNHVSGKGSRIGPTRSCIPPSATKATISFPGNFMPSDRERSGFPRRQRSGKRLRGLRLLANRCA